MKHQKREKVRRKKPYLCHSSLLFLIVSITVRPHPESNSESPRLSRVLTGRLKKKQKKKSLARYVWVDPWMLKFQNSRRSRSIFGTSRPRVRKDFQVGKCSLKLTFLLIFVDQTPEVRGLVPKEPDPFDIRVVRPLELEPDQELSLLCD